MADLTLESPAQFVKGAGPSRAALLEKADIHIVADLLKHLPRDYQPRPDIISIDQIAEGAEAAVCGIIDKITFQRYLFKAAALS